jgi:hypothetical protein
MGKQLVLNHVLQYVGNTLERGDIGKILRVMPYTNNEKIFEDFTQDYDNITNDILALDRGEYRPPNRYDDHKYIIKHLIGRMKQSDFEFMDQNTQQLYYKKLQEHESLEAQQAKEIQAAKDGFIPTGGYLVTCDFYISDPEKPSKSRRARIPYESLKWLIERLDTQGVKLKELEGLQKGALQDMAKEMISRKTRELPSPQGLPPAPDVMQAPISATF